MKDLLHSNSIQDNKLQRKLKLELVWHFSIKPFPSQHFPIKARSFCRINSLLNKIDSNACWGPQVRDLTCLFKCSVRTLIAMLVCAYAGWATLKAFGFWFRFLKNGDEHKSTNGLWGHKTQKWNMFLKWQRQDKKKEIITTESTLNYQRFQLFTVWSTPEKQLQSFRKCKVVTAGNLPICIKLSQSPVRNFLYLQWHVYILWSSFPYQQAEIHNTKMDGANFS